MDFTVRFASSAQDKDAAYELRRAVFEVEQGVPRPLDRDPHDFNADHVVAFDGKGRCVGTGRSVRLDSRTCQIGRMAVAREFRRQGVGAKVLDALERMASLRGVAEVVLHAQIPSEPFFRNRGYAREGEVFEDQGVKHVLMRKVLPR
jgi:predicted GNAT family N-acyltransferase